MAYPIQLTIGTGNKVSINYQSQEVNVSVTYQLESEDTDLLKFARDKASEIAAVHRIAWKQTQSNTQAKTATRTKTKSSDETDSTPEIASQKSEPKVEESAPETSITDGQLAALEALTAQADWSKEQTRETLQERLGKSELNELTTAQAAQLLLDLQRAERLKMQARSRERRAKTTPQNGHLRDESFLNF